MAYYEHSDSYYDYGDYQSDSRRNSNSFGEDINAPKRKKTNWGGRGRGGGSRQFSRGGGNRKAPARSTTIDTPLYQEPKINPPPPRRSPQVPLDGRKRGRERNNSFRSNVNMKPSFDARDMPEFIEREHAGPAWHWDNYVRGCKNWQDKHKLAYYQSRCTALEFENQMLFEQINQLIKENIVFAAERGRTPTMEVPNIPGYETQKVGDSSSSRVNKNQGNNSDLDLGSGTDIEFVITEDMVEYLETNIRHKLTLKKEKLEKQKGATGGVAVNEKKKNATGNESGGQKRPGLKRKEELEQLYGKNSTVIQGLETSLQLNFNRACDTFKPDIYPATPVNTVVA